MTMYCRLHTRHRVMITVRRHRLPRPIYLGTLIDDHGRPARREWGGRPVRGETTREVTLTTAPIRAGAKTATGLCELLTVLDNDAELFA